MKKKIKIWALILLVAGLRWGSVTKDIKFVCKKVRYGIEYLKYREIEKRLPYGLKWASEFYHPRYR